MRGATGISFRAARGTADFNPRTPCGVRLDLCDRIAEYDAFQSTHPLRGATRGFRLRFSARQRISIHAPLAGCDHFSRGNRASLTHFNPRTPCGVRPKSAGRTGTCRNFNPRTPCGVRRDTSEGYMLIDLISIHAPLAGCDRALMMARAVLMHFNPRTPCGVRLAVLVLILTGCSISIHAPLAGCDQRLRFRTCPRHDFNPRTPCGVRPDVPNCGQIG